MVQPAGLTDVTIQYVPPGVDTFANRLFATLVGPLGRDLRRLRNDGGNAEHGPADRAPAVAHGHDYRLLGAGSSGLPAPSRTQRAGAG